MDDLWLKFPKQNPDTPTRTIEGEAVVITPHDSRLHTLNETGTFIWERADGLRSLQAIASEMKDHFDVSDDQVKADALSFAQDAHDKGLLSFEMAAGAEL